MMPLLKFYYHDGVRMAASYAMPEFVKCAKKYADANGPPPPPQYGLSSDTMALITSGCGTMRSPGIKWP